MSHARDQSDMINRNAVLNQRECVEGRLVLKSRPIVVFVELSRRCNLACPMCHRWSLPSSTFVDMSASRIAWLEQELFPTAQIVDLHGLGESTLHPTFPDLVRRVTKLGARVRLVTNLNNVSEESLTVLIETNSYICFSLSALGQRAYSRIHAKGNFHNLSKNLSLLKRMRNASGTCSDMSCLSMFSSENLAHLPDLMHFLVDKEIHHLRIFPMYLNTGDRRHLSFHLEDWTKAVEHAFLLANQLDMEIRVIDWPVPPVKSSKTLSNFTCHRPWTHIHINVNGTIGLCDYNEHVETMSLLTIGEYEFDEIWNSSTYQHIRQSFLNGEPSLANEFCGDICRHTKYVDFDDVVLPELSPRVFSNKRTGY